MAAEWLSTGCRIIAKSFLWQGPWKMRHVGYARTCRIVLDLQLDMLEEQFLYVFGCGNNRGGDVQGASKGGSAYAGDQHEHSGSEWGKGVPQTRLLDTCGGNVESFGDGLASVWA